MSTGTTISIPEFCLVLLIGPSGSGKSTFAKRHFKETEIVSSDCCRAVVADDEADQSATGDAFDLVRFIAEKRLNARRLTVIDATNVRAEDRKSLIGLARSYHALTVGFAFFIDEAICHERNADRANRDFGPHVVRNQIRSLKRGFKGIRKREGVRQLYVFDNPEEVDAVESIARTPLWPDKRSEHGPFDIIGDVHGCAAELEELLEKLGYALEIDGAPGHRSYTVAPPDGRRLIFVGDLVDRGPRSPDVLRLVKGTVEAGTGFCVVGNHDDKLKRWLMGRKVSVTHGLEASIEQFESQPDGFAEEMRKFLDSLISHYVFEEGALVVAHAGLREDMQNRASGQVRSFAMYGDTTGEIDEFGLPVRADWAADYRGRAKVVFGHTPTPEANWTNGTICIDTGCCFGGKLTALRWPELELVDVPAKQTYYEPIRPLEDDRASASAGTDPVALKITDVQGKRTIETAHAGRVTLRENETAGALEVMSRFAVDPRWLIHLPPTMSPAATSDQGDWLERPEEAFAYYRSEGIERAVCEEKHMGSRAVITICRDAGVARSRFHADERTGVITSRTGRPFFDGEYEGLVLDRLRRCITALGWWERFESDWFCLDAEIMPWSVKAQSLLKQQYAPVAVSARMSLDATVVALRAAKARGVDVGDTLDTTIARSERAAAYAAAYRTYVWPVNTLDDLKIAPFHLLAAEGRTFFDQPHPWHMDALAELAAADGGMLMATPWRLVELNDDRACGEAAIWWESLVVDGKEGMVVKPEAFVARGKRGLVQPAIKVRGRDYLRIIYGPDYDAPKNLGRLRERGLGRKRSLASREFALGAEALERFVRHEPLSRVHECVFGVLALETEPVDPRL